MYVFLSLLSSHLSLGLLWSPLLPVLPELNTFMASLSSFMAWFLVCVSSPALVTVTAFWSVCKRYNIPTLRAWEGSLVAHSGRCTQSEGETLELWLNTHFPNLEVIQELPAPLAALLARCSDWRLASRVVTYRKIEWAIDSFASYKSPGVDGISRPCYKRNERLLSHTCSEYFLPACVRPIFQPFGNRLR